MNENAIIVMIAVVSVVWGGLLLLMGTALVKDAKKRKEDNL